VFCFERIACRANARSALQRRTRDTWKVVIWLGPGGRRLKSCLLDMFVIREAQEDRSDPGKCRPTESRARRRGGDPAYGNARPPRLRRSRRDAARDPDRLPLDRTGGGPRHAPDGAEVRGAPRPAVGGADDRHPEPGALPAAAWRGRDRGRRRPGAGVPRGSGEVDGGRAALFSPSRRSSTRRWYMPEPSIGSHAHRSLWRWR
jgi:hypothetical protein